MVGLAALTVVVFAAQARAEPVRADLTEPRGSESTVELGLPFTRSYDYREYGGHSQNWAVLQTTDGRMLFGNSDGILEYDGVQWNLIEVTNSSLVRSLAEVDGIVYVGAVGELGYLERDAAGQLLYVSLTDELPEGEGELTDFWFVWGTEDGVFFWTLERLYRWHRGQFTSIELISHAVPSLVHGRIYNNHPEEGLQVLRDGVFESVVGGELVTPITVSRMLPWQDDTHLIVAREGSLWLFSSPGIAGTTTVDSPATARLRPFETEIDDVLLRHRPYGVTVLPDGGFALGTRNGGVYIIEHDGRLRFHIDKSKGLPDDSVWAAGVDREDGLWLGLNRGLARLEASSPLTVFDDTAGLEGTVESIIRHRGRLVAATSAGTYEINAGRFQRLPELGNPPCWSLLSIGEHMLVGCNDGVFVEHSGRGRWIRDARNAFILYASPSRPGRIFSGEAESLGLLELQDGEWVDQGQFMGLSDRIRSIVEDASGHLWLGTQYSGVIRLTLTPQVPGSPPEILDSQRFTTDDGLPSLESVKVQRFADRALPIFATADGIYHLDASQQRLVPEPDFREATAGLPILRLAENNGQLWLAVTSGGTAMLKRDDEGSWHLESPWLHRLPSSDFYALYPEASGTVWIGGVEGLYRFQADGEPFEAIDFEVTVGAATATGPLPATAGITLPYSSNSLRFRFAAHSFHAEAETVYSHRLDGFDADWSPWTRDVVKEYTNLAAGDYSFQVRARNVYGHESRASDWTFTVRPPWYQTLAAYFCYLIAAALFVTAMVRWRSRQLEREKRGLELEVAARTQQLRASERKLRLALDGARMAAWAWDVEADRVDGWEEIAEVLGIDPADHGPTSHHYRRLVHPDDADQFDQIMAPTLDGRKGDYKIEHRILRPDGSIGWVLGKGRVSYEDGQPSAMTGILYDVSERKGVETELAAKNAELERFTYTVSHDLKSPLVTILGFLGFLRRDAEAGKTDRLVRDINRIEASAKKLERLLDDLLELSRVGRLDNPPQQVELGELAAEASKMVAGRINERGAEVTVAEDLPTVTGDRVRLLQVFQNLIDNAVKYTPEDVSSRVEIGCRSDPDEPAPVIYVRDNGLGIDPQHHERVFDLFQQLDADAEGTGVGLALVKRIIDHHGGRLWVESEGQGHGSTFCFTLG